MFCSLCPCEHFCGSGWCGPLWEEAYLWDWKGHLIFVLTYSHLLWVFPIPNISSKVSLSLNCVLGLKVYETAESTMVPTWNNKSLPGPVKRERISLKFSLLLPKRITNIFTNLGISKFQKYAWEQVNFTWVHYKNVHSCCTNIFVTAHVQQVCILEHHCLHKIMNISNDSF